MSSAVGETPAAHVLEGAFGRSSLRLLSVLEPPLVLWLCTSWLGLTSRA